jgi:UV DNA damage endonuclease
MSVQLGYACISMELSEKGISTSRTLRLDTIPKRGEAYMDELSFSNIDALRQTILYNEELGIRFFRITSVLFPHMENPRADKLLGKRRNIAKFADKLREVGALARSLGHRLTFHPDHFAQLGSPRPDIIDQTIRDLNIHAEILGYLGYTPELGSVMVIHGGGTYGDKAAALARFERNFDDLSTHIKQFIVLENDEWQYSVMDLLPLCERKNIPLVIDFFHHEIGHSHLFDIFDEELLERIIAIWRRRGIKPKCHWSNQKKDARKGTHDDYIDHIPQKILNFCIKYGVDIMCECKMKERCALRLLNKHFIKVEQATPGGKKRIEWRLKA